MMNDKTLHFCCYGHWVWLWFSIERVRDYAFFVVSELAEFAKEQILYAAKCGHEIACHGKTHVRPLMMEPKAFEEEIREAKATLEDLIGQEVIGYRAYSFPFLLLAPLSSVIGTNHEPKWEVMGMSWHI